MKKSKIISLLTSAFVVSTSAPILATACGNNDTPPEKKLEVTVNNVPTQIEKGKSSDACKITATYGGENANVLFASAESDNDFITGNWDSSTGKLTFVASASATDGDVSVKVVVKVEGGLEWTNTYTINVYSVTPPVVETNLMTYGGQEYELAANIDPNVFCGTTTPESKSAYIVPLKNGTNLTIYLGDYQHKKITSLSLKNCDSTKTTINDSFLRDCENLASLDLTGLGEIITIKSYFLMNCNAITSLNVNFDKFIKLETIESSFLANCKKFTEVDMSMMTSLKTMGSNFLQGCSNVTDLWVPFTSTPPTPTLTGSFFPANLKHIHCGKYLDDYKKNQYWGEKGIIELLEY